MKASELRPTMWDFIKIAAPVSTADIAAHHGITPQCAYWELKVLEANGHVIHTRAKRHAGRRFLWSVEGCNRPTPERDITLDSDDAQRFLLAPVIRIGN